MTELIYRWDEIEDKMTSPFKRLMKTEEEFFAEISRKDYDVLDMGCGTGRLLRKLSPL